MTHPLLMGLFATPDAAAAAVRELRELGLPRERISIVAQNHDIEADLSNESGGSPGSEIEDSRFAARLGELSAHFFAAAAIVLPGIGPIVADGPLAAGLGEAAGHLAGSLARTLEHSGVPAGTAEKWEERIREGAVLVAGHATAAVAPKVRTALTRLGASEVTEAEWDE